MRRRCGGFWRRPGLAVVAVLALAGCGGPRPILYPNEHLKQMGEAGAERDIAACRELAEQAGAKPTSGKAAQAATSTAIGAGIGAAAGAVGGAIVGAPGTGAAIGAASGSIWGLVSGLFGVKEPSQTHKAFVNRCLAERGYEPVGWE